LGRLTKKNKSGAFCLKIILELKDFREVEEENMVVEEELPPKSNV